MQSLALLRIILQSFVETFKRRSEVDSELADFWRNTLTQVAIKIIRVKGETWNKDTESIKNTTVNNTTMR